MWIALRRGVEPAGVRAELQALGLWTTVEAGRAGGVGLRVAPWSARVDAALVARVAGVRDVFEAASPHPRVDAQAGAPLVLGAGRGRPLALGPGAAPVLLAGPCAAESAAQVDEAAALVAAGGARVLRGGAMKPRSSPYDFQGVGREALGWLRAAADAHGLLLVTEALSEADAPAVAEVADLVQIGARSAQSYGLLRAVAATGAAVLLKRGPGSTVEEWLLAGEHLLASGASGVVFCERGVCGFEPSTRNLLDLGAVALLGHVLGQPVVVDPSHASGRRDLVAPLARAGLAAGAHGILVEVHPDPRAARSDGPQALDPGAWRALVASLRPGAALATCEASA